VAQERRKGILVKQPDAFTVGNLIEGANIFWSCVGKEFCGDLSWAAVRARLMRNRQG
jgi:hypothetical protein